MAMPTIVQLGMIHDGPLQEWHVYSNGFVVKHRISNDVESWDCVDCDNWGRLQI